jgi:polyisoprenoid-binding protein YceI
MNTREETVRFMPRATPRTARNGDLERWEIDATASRLSFTLRHVVIQEITGRFRSWGGTLYLDRAEPWLSTVEAFIDLGSVETDEPERDAHIRSEEFFDVAHNQRAEFESTSIEAREGRLLLRGLLRLHGVTHDFDLEVTPIAGGAGEARTVYRAVGTLDRQAFGLHWNQDLDKGGVVVGDEVEITADVTLVRPTDDARGNA